MLILSGDGADGRKRRLKKWMWRLANEFAQQVEGVVGRLPRKAFGLVREEAVAALDCFDRCRPKEEQC